MHAYYAPGPVKSDLYVSWYLMINTTLYGGGTIITAEEIQLTEINCLDLDCVASKWHRQDLNLDSKESEAVCFMAMF